MKKSKYSKKDNVEDEDSLADNTMALNPVIGISLQDLFKTGTKVIKQGILQPIIAAEHSVKLVGEWVRIALNASDTELNPRDRRFADPAFKNGIAYSRIAKGWLAWQNALNNWIDDADFSTDDRERAKFLAGLLTDALAPTNLLFGNPAALRKAVDTNGKSLLAGFTQFVDDMINNHGMPQQVDRSAFEVGGNLALSEGSVIFRHDILELIQYKPLCKKVKAKPVMIVPPQINKFYVYDLTPDKSVVNYLLSEGFQVFIVSWRNPTAEHRDWAMADYVEALVDAIDAIRDISKQGAVNVIGACAGGITCATTMGYLAGLKQMKKVSSLTLMVNVLEPMYNDSVAGLFATDGAIEMARKRSAKVGVLDGSEMARVFNWMRPNDLIWNYVVNNYLNGLPPPAYDVLFWNSDTTRLPARLHSDFLDVFLDNPFSNPGKMKIRDVEIDIGKVKCPVLITGGTTDHITPWQACYRSTQLFGGKANYVLSTAGHIQSLINPPEAIGSKRKYFISDSCPPNADDWFEQAEENQGSWWPYWSKWLAKHSGRTINAPKTLGNKTYKPLIKSPGKYVHE